MADRNAFLAIVPDDQIIRLGNLMTMQRISSRTACLLADAALLLGKSGKLKVSIDAEFNDILAFSKSISALNEGYVPENIPAMQNLINKIESTLESIRAKFS